MDDDDDDECNVYIIVIECYCLTERSRHGIYRWISFNIVWLIE
jgi:hypothetical protein